MRSALRASALGFVMSILVVATGGPSEANTRGARDPRDSAPGVDITRMTATFTADEFRVRVRVPRLARSGELLVVLRNRHTQTTDGRYLDIRRGRDRGVRAVYYDNSSDEIGPVCPVDARWNVRRGLITASMEGSCTNIDKFGVGFYLFRDRFDDVATVRGLSRS